MQRENIRKDGFTIVDDIYSPDEVTSIIKAIEKADQSNPNFRKTADLFAIRSFLKEIPEIKPLVFTKKLLEVINELFGDGYFAVKSIYFDKPEKSNWFVAWHQDLTIAVNNKADIPGYGPWTVKPGQFAVQPPLDILLDNLTIRIHLDDTDEGNGALKIIPGSHLNIRRVDDVNWQDESETTCNVKAGGAMIMRPLLFHASSRSTTDKKRRVIHIEFSKANLAMGISWAEKEVLSKN